MPSAEINDSYDAVVIGGGPAGATSAIALARRGCSVLLLERARFPRFHIGESMLTYTAELISRLGLAGTLGSTDFPVKTGAEFSDDKGRTTRVDFTDQGAGRVWTTFQVERADFDAILLGHAAATGAQVVQEARVSRIDLDSGRVVGVSFSAGGLSRSVRARRVVDASGRAGLITQGVLRSRKVPARLRMVAVFRHFDGVDESMNPGVEGDIQIGSHADGWVWAIPIRPAKLSVGTVTRPSILKEAPSTSALFADHLARIPRISQRVAGLTTCSEIRVESDFTYYSEHVAGPGYFVAGDAACFVDPIFSAGVYLAMTTGLRAGELAADVLDGTLSEDQAIDLYSRFYKTGYDTYFRLIYAFYDHDLRLGRFLKSTGVMVAPEWISRLLGGDFWSYKNPLARHLRCVPEYQTFSSFEPLYGCPVYPELEAAERYSEHLGDPLPTVRRS